MDRIVSLAPSNTEIIFALGEGGRLVGVTESCDYPHQAKSIEKIGGYSTPDIERIISLSPDLVLATDFHLKTPIVSQLKTKGISIHSIETKTILDVSEAILLIGKLIAQESKAYQLAQDIKTEIEAINERTRHLIPEERPRVCYICLRNPFRFAREGCCANKFIEIAGGINIGKGILQAEMNLESIAERNPDVIFVSSGHGEVVDLIDFVKKKTILHNTVAYQNNRVYRVEDDLITRFGPRIVKGLRRFAELIHPQIFGEAK